MDASWKTTAYPSSNQSTPSMRWGHKMVTTLDSSVILFGGYGNQNKNSIYLNDVWKYDTVTMQWRELKTKGDIPSGRSNFTMNYNQKDDQIIIFGGGGDQKARFNSVCILDMKTLTWRQEIPNQDTPAPWERTYHTAEFIYPYLITYGGEGVSNLDLSDLWAFHIVQKQWILLKTYTPATSILSPGPRRFHSSCLHQQKLIIISGCRNCNYDLLGDIYSLDLTSFLNNQQKRCSGKGLTTEYGSLEWKVVLQDEQLKRWGHSCNILSGSIFIYAGRKGDIDNRDLLKFSLDTNTLTHVQSLAQSAPQGRRRHSSTLIGGSLLIFGGYNGSYLSDSHCLNLSNLPNASYLHLEQPYIKDFNTFELYQQQIIEPFQSKIKDSEITLRIYCLSSNNVIAYKIEKGLLMKNSFFSSLIKFHDASTEISISLKKPFEVLAIKIILMYYSLKKYCFPLKDKSPTEILEFLMNFCSVSQYFCCEKQMFKQIELFLLELVNQNNFQKLMIFSCQFEFEMVFQKCFYFFLKSIKKQLKDTHFASIIKSNFPSNTSLQIKCSLEYKLIRFSFQQELLKDQKENLIFKAIKQIKNCIKFATDQQSKFFSNFAIKKQKNKPIRNGCFLKVLNAVTSLYRNEQKNEETLEQFG